MGVAHLMRCALIRINTLTFTRAFWNAYAVMEGGKQVFAVFKLCTTTCDPPLSIIAVTLDTFIDFLTICESNGFIELKLSVEELREQVRTVNKLMRRRDWTLFPILPLFLLSVV